jgi:serine phosphatase RsbU (regulator of sigma subunit)/Tfp pilus assembly protein PilF
LLAKAILFSDPIKAIQLSDEALTYYTSKKDTINCMNIYNTMGVAYAIMGKYDSSEVFFMKKLDMSRKSKDKNSEASALSSLGNVYHSISQYKKSIECYDQAYEIFVEQKSESGMANVLGNIGNAYKAMGNYQEALTVYFKAMKLNEKLNKSTGPMLSNIGNIFADMDDTRKAKIYFHKSIKVFKEEQNDYYVAWGYTNLASVYFDEGNIEKSEEYYLRAIAIHEAIGDREGIANAYHAMGNIDFSRKKMESAIINYDSAVKIYASIGLNFEYAKVHIDQGMLQMELGNKREATTFFKKAYENIDYFAYDYELAELYQVMAMASEWNGDYKNAFEFQRLHGEVRDSLFKTELAREIADKEAKYQNEKKQKEIQKLKHQKKLDDLKAQEEKERTSMIMNFSFLGGFMLFLIVIILIRSNRMKYKSNRLLQEQNDEISHQKEIIQEKNKDITDSINYAQNIQQAILPDSVTAKNILGESFVLFLPRDIVSGDFYWMHRMENGEVFFAVADCTGHGVPGAFMSMMGNDMLNKIIIDHGISDTGKALTELNNEVKKALAKNISSDRMRDGMDITLCKLSSDRSKVHYSSAMRSVYHISGETMNEVKGDKSPIGGNTDFDFAFSSNEFNVKKGDCIFLSTDGFADQFGGSDGKKFMSKNLKDLFMKNKNETMDKQCSILTRNFKEWRSSFEQVDDVTVLGIRI